MKRRGFLGFLGGAAVAGPSMAKQAVSATRADMNLAGVASTTMGLVGSQASGAPYPEPYSDDWGMRVAKLAMRSQAEHQERQRNQYISGLDPDLTTYRSFALHTKIAMQKKRDYWRSIENEKSWLQRRIDGIFDW